MTPTNEEDPQCHRYQGKSQDQIKPQSLARSYREALRLTNGEIAHLQKILSHRRLASCLEKTNKNQRSSTHRDKRSGNENQRYKRQELHCTGFPSGLHCHVRNGLITFVGRSCGPYHCLAVAKFHSVAKLIANKLWVQYGPANAYLRCQVAGSVKKTINTVPKEHMIL